MIRLLLLTKRRGRAWKELDPRGRASGLGFPNQIQYFCVTTDLREEGGIPHEELPPSEGETYSLAEEDSNSSSCLMSFGKVIQLPPSTTSTIPET